MTVSERLRQTIQASNETHYRIGKETGVDISIIDRFVSGERPNIKAHTIDKVCDYLGLELCRKKRRKRAETKPKQGRKKA